MRHRIKIKTSLVKKSLKIISIKSKIIVIFATAKKTC